MRISQAATLLACTAASGVNAFTDSAPFILFSSADLPNPSSESQLQTSSSVLSSAKSLLSGCPTDKYILISQPNLHASDIRSENCLHTPNLCRAIRSPSTKSTFSVAEVIGQISGAPLKEHITKSCSHVEPSFVEVEMKQLPPVGEKEGERKEILEDNDHKLGEMLSTLGEDEDYTVLIFSDPHEIRPYRSEFASGGIPTSHMDLKRGLEVEDEDEFEGMVNRRKDETARDNRPLFEKYQFFTPGIFMALVVLVIVLAILSVGIKALASLEVSYGAFDKEMGPAAQKKQQ
ncbi:BIG/ATPase V1 complex, subunit S1 [Triangularia verruculosa]|uniref:Protein BIG1 n=1 Tax=Triangularia verruculosa TaxID=2587418 RepID=A0AAN6XN46_9PEZI|nr:BIG/ATPase V1 complex, subunit S1 [Triangularia verruculosa]